MKNHPDNNIYLQSKQLDLLASISTPEDKQQIPLKQFIEGIQQGAWHKELEHYRQLLPQAAQPEVQQKLRALKLKLPAVTLSGTFATTKEDSLLEHSGLLQIDIDLKSESDREQFYQIYRSGLCFDPFMVAVFDSPSYGVKGIFHLGVCEDKQQHKELALAAHQYLKETYSIEERLLDTSTLNLGRRFSASYDPEIFINWAAADFSQSDLVTEYLKNIRNTLLTRSSPQSLMAAELAGFSCNENERKVARYLLKQAGEAIRRAEKGKRFEMRRRQAFKIGGYWPYFDGEEALHEMLVAAMGNCSSKEKAKRDVISAYQAGKQHPLKIELKEREEQPKDVAQLEEELAQFYPLDESSSRQLIPRGKYLSEMLQSKHYQRDCVTTLVASTGSGKMFAIKRIQEKVGERVIYVSPLVRLVEQAKQDLGAVGYTDGLHRIPSAKIFATTINSLCSYKLGITQLLKELSKEHLQSGQRKLTLVLDEVHEIAEKLFEPSCETNYPEFVEFCRNYVSRIVTLTATETCFSREFTQELSHDLTWQENHYLFEKSAERIKLQHLSLPRNDLLPQVLELIEQKQPQRSLVILQSKEKTEALSKALLKTDTAEAEEISLVNADRDTPLNQQAKFIIGSPSLATGISFTSQIDLFVLVTEDSIFRPHDLEQYTARIRNPDSTEFYVLTMRHLKQGSACFERDLNNELFCLLQLEQSINEQIEAGRFQQHQERLVRLLDYDSTQQCWSFHGLYRLLEAERGAFRRFCISHGAQAFVRYLRQHPHRDYSFVIEKAEAQFSSSSEAKQLSKSIQLEAKAERVLKFAESEQLENIAAYQEAQGTLKSLQMKIASERVDELEVFQEQKAQLPLQLKKTEAALLGVRTKGLDYQRCKECVTKAYRYASLLSLITMTQLPAADQLYRRMMTRWANEDYITKLYLAPKWAFAKEVLKILCSKESAVKQTELLKHRILKLRSSKFNEIFALRATEQNRREVLNKLGCLIEHPKLAWQQLGVDYRVYRDVLTELKGSAEVAGDESVVLQLLELQTKLGKCASSEDLRAWYNGFMSYLKENWGTLEHYQSANWSNAERRRKTLESEATEELREQLAQLRSRLRSKPQKRKQPTIFFN